MFVFVCELIRWDDVKFRLEYRLVHECIEEIEEAIAVPNLLVTLL